ncbi:MAG: cellulose biosynthesis cyclic di-GMP-binding regulatory protein BcsB, partial [Pseudomonadota bacterium]
MTKTTLTRLASGICLATIFLASAAAAAQVKTPQSQAELKREPALDLLRLIANGRSADLDTLAITGTVVKAGALDRVLYHLPQHARGLRLAGEWSAREFPIHLTRDQLRGTVTFRLTYQNAVSVMPEASNLAVFINDREVSSRPINSPDRARTLEFDLPSLALRPGENSIRIEARQRHRVDCSIDATHELWTEIVPAATGFIFEDGTGSIDTITELGALPLTKSGKVLVNVVVANMNDTATIERGMMLAQETALAAGFSAPVVSVSSRFGEGPGLDLFAGTLDELRLLDASHAKAVGEDSALTIIAQDGVDRVALIALDGAEIGPAKVVRHDHMAGRILAGEEVAFADLGLKSRSFDGRVLHDGFDLRLPQDAFAADYDNVELNLAFAYAAGLERGAQIIVRVNGATVLGLPLTKPAGAVERNRSLRMPLSAFNPGDNHIEFEASVPASADAKCDPRQQIEGPQRF